VSDFTALVDLASERVGGAVLAANDDFFAPKENLILSSQPVFIEGKYTDRGKWMDGWETRRRREPGHDWAILRLGLPGIVRGVVIDTSFFTGNFPSHGSVEACAAEPSASPDDLAGSSTQWMDLLPKSGLTGDTQNLFAVTCPYRCTHVRLNIFPDGGVARFRVYGEALPDWPRLLAQSPEVDLAAVEHGGRVLAASDMIFGSRHNLILPGPGRNMGDGWETRRRRGPGYDWCIVQLGTEGRVRRVEVDTAFFKGNFPEGCSLEGCNAGVASLEDFAQASWKELLPRTKLHADTKHTFDKELRSEEPMTHVRLNIFPDGGVSRLRVFGTVTPEGRVRAGLRRLNTLTEPEARAALLACCGSRKWADALLRERPFQSAQQLRETVAGVWQNLGREDWLEAFGAHPRIGEKPAAHPSATAAKWSEQEQVGVRGAGAAFQEANRAYESRFGHLFIVCATGRTGDEMLALLRQRLQNGPGKELRIAAEEQQRITQLRLEKLLTL
jgi:allantoicase